MKILQLFLILTGTFSWLAFDFHCPNNTGSNKNEVERPSVEIRTTSGGNIAAVVKNDPAFPKSVFLLQSSDQVTLSNSISLINTSVNYSGNCVIFQSKDNGQNIIFKLTGTTGCGTPSNNIGIYDGYGLANQNGDNIYNAFIGSGGSFPDVQEFSCSCNQTGTSSSDCDSGGEGSNGCSTTSTIGPVTTGCSVDCNDGYYACCID